MNKTSKVPAWACSRCETYEGVDSKAMTLLGGLSTRLCEKCENAWDDACMGEHAAKYKRLDQIRVEMEALMRLCASGQDKRPELEKLRTEKYDLMMYFKDASKVFMKAAKEEQAP